MRVQISFKNSPSLTEQCHADSCRIQNILAKHQKTGVINHVNQFQGQYLDMVDAPNYREAQTLIADANSVFETVPAFIRKDMNNDPAQFLNFMQNEKNIEAIQAYGLDASHLASEPIGADPLLPPSPPPQPAPPPSSEAEE